MLRIEFVNIIRYGGYILFTVSFADLFFYVIRDVFDVLVFFIVCECLFLIDHQAMFRSSLICAVMCLGGNTLIVGVAVLFVLVVLRVIMCLLEVVVNQLALKFVVRVKFTSCSSHINWLLLNGVIYLSLNHLRDSFKIIFLYGLHFTNLNSCVLSVAVKIIFMYKFFHLGWILSACFL